MIESKELRNSPRVDYKEPVDLILNGRLHKEMSANVSDSGIFLVSSSADTYQVHDKLTLSFIAPGLKPVKRIGWVVRTTPGGIGVAYIGEIIR